MKTAEEILEYIKEQKEAIILTKIGNEFSDPKYDPIRSAAIPFLEAIERFING